MDAVFRAQSNTAECQISVCVYTCVCVCVCVCVSHATQVVWRSTTRVGCGVGIGTSQGRTCKVSEHTHAHTHTCTHTHTREHTHAHTHKTLVIAVPALAAAEVPLTALTLHETNHEIDKTQGGFRVFKWAGTYSLGVARDACVSVCVCVCVCVCVARLLSVTILRPATHTAAAKHPIRLGWPMSAATQHKAVTPPHPTQVHYA